MTPTVVSQEMLVEFHKAAWGSAKIVQSESRLLVLSLSSETALSVSRPWKWCCDPRRFFTFLSLSLLFWKMKNFMWASGSQLRMLFQYQCLGVWHILGCAGLAGYTISKMPSGSRNLCGLLDVAVACGASGRKWADWNYRLALRRKIEVRQFSK